MRKTHTEAIRNFCGRILRDARSFAARRIGIENDGEIEIINLHGIPEDITADVGKNGIYPGWHMNKKHWYTVVPDGALPLDELCRRVDESYRLAGKRK